MAWNTRADVLISVLILILVLVIILVFIFLRRCTPQTNLNILHSCRQFY